VKIRIVNPTTHSEWRDRSLGVYQAQAAPGSELSVVFVEQGPESVESDYDILLSAPGILAQVRRAEAEGMDAVVIDCMSDPALFAARELVSIPVVGPAQAAMSLAATLADRFSVVTILERDRPMIHNQWRLYDLQARGASIRSVNIPVLDLAKSGQRLCEAMIAQATLAVAEDGAQAIVFGCTGMGGLAAPVRAGLAQAGYPGVPVLDPTGVALKWAECLVGLGLSHSKQTFPVPPPKKITGYEAFGLA
jgi:allantoin racemase